MWRRRSEMASKLGTAFELLQLFERPECVRMSVAEVTAASGLGKSTVSETLAALADEGYLLRIGQGSSLRYAMGPRFQEAFANAIAREVARLEQARAAMNAEALIVTEPLRRLAEAIGAAEPRKGELRMVNGETTAAPTASTLLGMAAPECGALG